MFAVVAVLILVPKHVKELDEKLRREMYDKIETAFRGKDKVVDVLYSGEKVKYTRGSIPEKPKQYKDEPILNESYPERLDEWKSDYGDLYKMYDINWKGGKYSWQHEDGWALIEISKDYEGVYTILYFPYAVGYKRQDYSWDYDYAPSVESAVKEAFDFYTTDRKSNFYDNLEKGGVDRILHEVDNNRYYTLSKDEEPRMWFHGVNIDYFNFDDLNRPKGPFKHGYMYNGYYKVFLGRTQCQTWTIKRGFWNSPEADKRRLYLKWLLSLTGGVLLLLLPFLIILGKANKRRNESLEERLLRLCNPANYARNYNGQKVGLANALYREILATAYNDRQTLYDLADRAVEELGVKIIEDSEWEELIKMLNPKNFMKPYNAEKISLANSLMERLSGKLTYAEYAEIVAAAKRL